MSYKITNLFRQIGNKLFRVYISKDGSEGTFVTIKGRRVFVKFDPLLRSPQPDLVAKWSKEIERLGGLDALDTSKDFRSVLFGTPKVVHSAFLKLWKDWPSAADKKWYYELIEDWHLMRGNARRTLTKLVKEGTQTNPFWEEVYALNAALLDKEFNKTARLFRGVSISNIPKDYLVKPLAQAKRTSAYQLRIKRKANEVLLNILGSAKRKRSGIIVDYPFASFSSRPDVALIFGDVAFADIPISRIVAHWRVGLGSTREREYIVHAPIRTVSALNVVPYDLDVKMRFDFTKNVELNQALGEVLKQAKFYPQIRDPITVEVLKSEFEWFTAGRIGRSRDHIIYSALVGTSAVTPTAQPDILTSVTLYLFVTPSRHYKLLQRRMQNIADTISSQMSIDARKVRDTMEKVAQALRAEHVLKGTSSDFGPSINEDILADVLKNVSQKGVNFVEVNFYITRLD